jgi:hypothetical protein
MTIADSWADLPQRCFITWDYCPSLFKLLSPCHNMLQCGLVCSAQCKYPGLPGPGPVEFASNASCMYLRCTDSKGLLHKIHSSSSSLRLTRSSSSDAPPPSPISLPGLLLDHLICVVFTFPCYFLRLHWLLIFSFLYQHI